MADRATTRVIRIDREVEKALIKSSRPHESWNATLRRVLGLAPKKRRKDRD